MTPDPFRIPDDWYRGTVKIPGSAAAASGDAAPARKVRRPSGRGSTFARIIALAALACCVELLWPSIRGGA